VADVHSREARSRNMSAIRAKNTRPEMLVRRALHAAGLRYRLHGAKLPGRPDIVLPRHHAVIFVHGCFFHGHNCRYFRWPETRAQFWREKIAGNQTRDARNVEQLRELGWRVHLVWECTLRQPPVAREAALRNLIRWVRSAQREGETCLPV
jgi:DNA mismatch endonuclease, patch repair protein